MPGVSPQPSMKSPASRRAADGPELHVERIARQVGTREPDRLRHAAHVDQRRILEPLPGVLVRDDEEVAVGTLDLRMLDRVDRDLHRPALDEGPVEGVAGRGRERVTGELAAHDAGERVGHAGSVRRGLDGDQDEREDRGRHGFEGYHQGPERG
jgi:hypothetical protein